MALYNEMSMDDYNKLVARNQQRQSQAAAQNLANRQAVLQATQGKKQGSLVDTLVGLATGLKDKAVDAYDTAKTIGKTAVGAINQIGANKEVENRQKDDSKRRNEIAKKYGFNSYSEAANSGNASDDFWNEIKGTAKETQQNLKNDADWRKSQVGNVQDINLNKAAGQALNTIDTVGMALGGGAGVAANILGGGLAGIGDQYKADAEAGKKDLNWDNFSLKNAAAGAAGGAAGSAAGGLLGKAATKAGGNLLGRALGSQLGQGIGSGAAAGAAGGFAGTLANGGSLQDALSNAWEGAKGGAVAGGAMAGTMGLAGNALNRIRGGNVANIADNAPIRNAEPVEAQIVQKNRVEAPTSQRIEAETTPRGIAIKDLNAGAESIPVRQGATQSQGKYIDSVVRRSDANLPEAKMPTIEQRFAKEYDAPLERIIANGDMGDGVDILDVLKNSGVKQPELAAIKTGAVDAQELMGGNPFTAYNMNSRQDLPLLNRQEYYNDTIGKIGRDSNANLRAEDVPSYMQDRLRNDAGKGFGSNIDNETILSELFGDNMDKADMYRLYEELASTPKTSAYTAENFANALYIDPELSNRIQAAMLEQSNPTRKIDVQGGPTIADNIPVTDRTTRYAENTLPAKQYEQAVAKMPEAETTANRAAASAPEAQVMPQVESGKATGWGEKDMTNASKKRNLLQKIGNTLEETGQATKDSQVYSKLKGNTAEEMARKGSVQKLRELGFNSTDYDKAANLSEVSNKYYDDAIRQTKTPIEAPQLRNIANEVADDLRLTMENRADLEKLVNGMLDDAVAKDGKMSNYSLDRYTPADLEKVAKAIGVKEQNITTTNMGGSKKANKNLTPENEQYALALREVRNRLRNEIGEMADYNPSELRARLKSAGATQKQIDYIMQDGTLKGVKARTSLFEDARTMNQQIKSDALKRGANATNSTNFVTQVANASGASNAVNMLARPVANAIGSVEKVAGKTISGLGNALAGDSEALKGAGKAAANIAGKAGEKLGNATSKLNDTTAANIAIGGNTLGNIAQNMANRTIAKDQAEFANNRANAAQAQAAYDQAATDYTTALANQQAAEQNVLQGQTSNTATLNRISQAMDLAMAAGDINAYSQLADLYKRAYNIYKMQNPTSKAKDAKDLTASQSKALAAQQQLQALAQMTPNAGTVASNIPLIGNLVDLTGGNEYATASEALATTLGYLLSGANIKESEAKSIGKSYVPSVFDSEEVKQRKLAQAQDLINSYLGDTSMLQR